MHAAQLPVHYLLVVVVYRYTLLRQLAADTHGVPVHYTATRTRPDPLHHKILRSQIATP